MAHVPPCSFVGPGLALLITGCDPAEEPLPAEKPSLPPPALATLSSFPGEDLPNAVTPRVELVSTGANVVDAQGARHQISLPGSAPSERVSPMLEFALPAAMIDQRVVLAVDKDLHFARVDAIISSLWQSVRQIDLAAHQGSRPRHTGRRPHTHPPCPLVSGP